MKGIVARFRHGPKAGAEISEEGKIVLENQGKQFAIWMLSQRKNAETLRENGVDLSLFYSGVSRAGTSATEFAKGFEKIMNTSEVKVKTGRLTADERLAERKDVDKTAWQRAWDTSRQSETRFLRAVHRSPKLVSGESPKVQGSRVEQWASEHMQRVRTAKTAPVKAVIGFSHEPVMGSARGVAHPKEHRGKYLVTPGRRAITAPGGLITHISDVGKATLHEMRLKKGEHVIDYVGHLR